MSPARASARSASSRAPESPRSGRARPRAPPAERARANRACRRSHARAQRESAPTSQRPARASQPLQRPDDAAGVGEREAAAEAMLELSIGPDELPELVPEQGARPLGVAVELGAVMRVQALGGELAQERPEPVVEVERVRRAE